MSLRYALPIPDDNSLCVPEELQVPPKFPSFGTEPFRPGSDVSKLAMRLVQAIRVQLHAAVGSGKSVKVPAAIHGVTRGLVVHVTPSRLLSWQLFDYVRTVVDVPVAFQEDYRAPIPEKGVLMMSSADLVAMIITRRAELQAKKFVLFLDESHESDAYTTTLRELGTVLPGVDQMVLSSATFDPDGFRPPETAGTRSINKFEPESVADWDPEDEGKPWSVSEIAEDTLMFVERDPVAARMVSTYRQNGIDAYRVHARMGLEKYQAILDLMARPDRGIVLLVADYSFRSGFTFPTVANIIDSGEVATSYVKDGQQMRGYRAAYKFEVEQTAGRGGRVAGVHCQVFRPDYRVENTICDTEGVEVDAVALLYRVLGFKPPAKYKVSKFYHGQVPINLAAALRGSVPLANLSDAVLGPANAVPVPLAHVMHEPMPTRRMTPVVLPRFPKGTSRPPSPEHLDMMHPDDLARLRSVGGRSSGFDGHQDGGSQIGIYRSPTPSVRQGGSAAAGPELKDDLFSSGPTGLEAAVSSLKLVDDRSSPSPVPVVDRRAKVESVMDKDAIPQGKASSLEALWEDSDTSRVASPSSVDSGVTESISGFSAAASVGEAFDELLRNLVPAAPKRIVLGQYVYYPGSERVTANTSMFPEGAKSVLRLLETGSALQGLSYGERVVAVKVLLDEYNDALTVYKAVQRVAGTLPGVANRISSVVDPEPLRRWVCGLAEELTCASGSMGAFSKAATEVFAEGFVQLDAELFAAREVELARGYAHQLEDVVSVKTESQSVDYASQFLKSRVASRPLKTIAGFQPAGFNQKRLTTGEGFSAKPERSLQLLRGPDHPVVAHARYKMNPDSGASPFVTRLLMKLIGSGNVTIHG